MNPYEYPDFWFPGCIEYECMVDPYRFLPPTTDEVTELNEQFDPGSLRRSLQQFAVRCAWTVKLSDKFKQL